MKKLVYWLISFVASIALAKLTGGNQGIIFLAIQIVLMFLYALMLLIPNSDEFKASENIAMLLLAIVITLVVSLGATWLVAKIFDITFLKAYQILCLGQALAPNVKK